jgi:uncharacterized Ntn-hydrolase superfamily protein
MTFSIVARCSKTGMLGIAVASSSPAVAGRCAHARAKVGAVASQNVTDPSLGARALDLMELGAQPGHAVQIFKQSPHIEHRQILIVDSKGRSAVFSGAKALGVWADICGENFACGGNLLSTDIIPKIMAEAFVASEGYLGDRILIAMIEAVKAGGEAGPIHSAGLKLVAAASWPVADLRVDWTDDCPIEGLKHLWAIYKPQLEDYVQRAIDPSAAPKYGVPGET